VEFSGFDEEYVNRLRNGDGPTQRHFNAYVEQQLRVKLQARKLTSEEMENLRQETFLRVIALFRKGGKIRQPEGFGTFVNSICSNVLLEWMRSR
jgi:RNA polymerase sigma-70 factor, ECF subfamily